MPTQHLIAGHLVEVDGDVARVEADLLATFVRAAGVESIGERYTFAARRTAAGWRLTSVATRLVWRR